MKSTHLVFVAMLCTGSLIAQQKPSDNTANKSVEKKEQPPVSMVSPDQQAAMQLQRMTDQLSFTAAELKTHELSVKYIRQARAIQDMARSLRQRPSQPATAPAPPKH